MHLFCLFCFRWHGFRLPKLGSRQRWRSHWIRGLILCCLAFRWISRFSYFSGLRILYHSEYQVRKIRRRSAKKKIILAYKFHRSAFKKTNWFFTRLHMDNRLIGTELLALNWERVPFLSCFEVIDDFVSQRAIINLKNPWSSNELSTTRCLFNSIAWFKSLYLMC